MGIIVAIGGGENGHHNTKYETAIFDKKIIELTKKASPNFLFIGLANRYPEYYFEVMNGIYGEMYGCKTEHLTYDDIKNPNIAKCKIAKADIIYVGGGNTYKLMTLFRRFGIDKLLTDAYNAGKVMCGVSAGAICWCSFGNSDSRKLSSGKNQIIKVSGLGFLDILFCPHFLKEKDRAESLKQMMKRTYKIPSLALDHAALMVVDDVVQILKLEQDSVAKKCYWAKGKYIEEDLSDHMYYDKQKLFNKG